MLVEEKINRFLMEVSLTEKPELIEYEEVPKLSTIWRWSDDFSDETNEKARKLCIKQINDIKETNAEIKKQNILIAKQRKEWDTKYAIKKDNISFVDALTDNSLTLDDFYKSIDKIAKELFDSFNEAPKISKSYDLALGSTQQLRNANHRLLKADVKNKNIKTPRKYFELYTQYAQKNYKNFYSYVAKILSYMANNGGKSLKVANVFFKWAANLDYSAKVSLLWDNANKLVNAKIGQKLAPEFLNLMKNYY